MNLKQLRAKFAALGKELAPLYEKGKAGTLTDDESGEYDRILSEMNEIGPQILEMEQRQADAEANLDIMNGKTGAAGRELIEAPASAVAVAAGMFSERKSIGRQFIESEQFKRSAARDYNMKGDKFVVTDQSIMYEKALAYSGTPSASMILDQVLPEIYRGTEKVSAVRQVLGSMNTTSNAVTVLRENVFTNSAAEVAEATTVSGGMKPESGITFTEESFAVRTVAHWVPITRDLLEDLPMMEGYIDGRLRDGLERRVDAQLINGDGNAPNISGLLDQSGLTVADNAYFAANPVRDAGEDNEQPNRIRRAKRLVQTAGRARPTFILANPTDVETWDTLTTTDGQYLFGGPLLSGSVGRMWGLPVYEDENIAANTVIVGDGSAAAVIDRKQAAVYTTDSHSDYFTRNILVLLAECRLTLAVFRPAAFCVVTMS
jgi:HK97 family phage major capsid protein